MDYRILIDTMVEMHRANVSQTHGVIKTLFRSAKEESGQYASYEFLDDDELINCNEYKYYSAIYKVVNTFLEQSRFIGVADDFHNLAVEFANNEEQDVACRILEIGIKCFPDNVDLLADYLAYCNGITDIESEEFDDSAESYRRALNEIPRQNWNWRGFLFSGIYLLEHLEGKTQKKINGDLQDTELKKAEIKNLILDYKRYWPTDERAILLEYRFAKFSGTAPEELTRLLESAIHDTPVRRTLRVAFKLAKIYFDKKKYRETVELLNRCLVDGVNNNDDNDPGEMYLLLAMSKLSKYYSDHIDSGSLFAEDDSAKRETVESIYSDFAAYSNSSAQKRDVLTWLKILNLQTGVHNKFDIAANVSTD